MTTASLLVPGFSEPVHEAQQVFRRALTALSEPGTIQQIADAPSVGGLAPATYALSLCLLDSDTPVWLSPSLDTPELRANLAFHCGCPVVSDSQQAGFALLDAAEAADFPELNPGTDRDPDLSCTVLMQLNDLDGGQAATWQGPGILGNRVMHLPLTEAFWAWRGAHAFPRGLDVFFTAGDSLVGLPRSTRVLRMMQEEN